MPWDPGVGEGNEDDKLKNATLSSLSVANEHSVKSLAFPAISTGIFGFPLDRCACIMVGTTLDFMQKPSALDTVVFFLFSADAFEVFNRELDRFGFGSCRDLLCRFVLVVLIFRLLAAIYFMTVKFEVRQACNMESGKVGVGP